MSKRGHRKFGLFAHITWHTWRRERNVRRCDVEVVGRGILVAAERQAVHVLAQAVLADHVHVVISFRPNRAITPFVRDAKSESARRVNTLREGRFRWARGYYAGSLSHSHVPAARNYLATQYPRHPDLVPHE